MTPLILTADEAVLAAADKLTEIRRPCDPQPAHSCWYEMNANGDKALHRATAEDGGVLFVPVRGDSADHRLPCPFGTPGELLYVCEAGRSWEESCERECAADEEHVCGPHCSQTYVAYQATPRRGYRPVPDRATITYLDESTPLENHGGLEGPWQSAETMPVWASRFAYRGRVRVELAGGVWQWVGSLERVNRENGAPVPPVECQ